MKRIITTLTFVFCGVIQGNTQSFVALEIDSSSKYDYTPDIVGWGYFRTLDAYEYDNFGRLKEQLHTIQTTEEIGGPSATSNCKKYTYTYGPDTKAWLVETCSSPDTSYNIERITQTLDPASNVLHHLYEDWYMPEWYATAQAFFTYSLSGKMTERLSQQWDWMSSSWQNSSSELREYDAAGNEILRQLRKWEGDSADWILNRMWNYTYDSQNRKIEEIESVSQWVGYPLDPWKRNTWHYNIQGQIDTARVFVFDGFVWKNNNMEISGYDAEGHLIEKQVYIWSNNQWKPQQLQTFFPGTGIYGTEPDSAWYYRWQSSQQQFEYTGHETYFYEDLPDSTVYFRHELWELMGMEWVVTLLEESWHFHAVTTSTKNVPEASIKTLCEIPNPYTIGQTVKCSALDSEETHYVRAFDMAGHMVYSAKIENNEGWKIDGNLPFGLYNVIIFRQNQPITAQKIVIAQP